MEFALDQYASVDLTYFGNGILFNRIPLVKKLKMREVLTFKGFMGHLSKRTILTATKTSTVSRPTRECGTHGCHALYGGRRGYRQHSVHTQDRATYGD